MFQRIVVPLDGSERAEQALPLAARLARASGGSLLLLQVAMPSPGVGLPVGEAALFGREMSDEELGKVRRSLETLAASETLAGIPVAIEVITGHPAEGILSVATSKQADLIVMCSHGYSGIKRWMLGSVAQQIARQSAIPVLILREGRTLPTMPLTRGDHPVRIMVALDGSPLAETVLTPAAYLSAALSAPQQGVLYLVRILRLSMAFEYGQNDSFARARVEKTREAKAYLSAIEARFHQGELGRLNLKVTSFVDYDLDVAQRLLVLAENDLMEDELIGCDMLALATHGRSGIARWAVGSVAERLLGATKLPLLIVRPRPEQFAAQSQNDEAATRPARLDPKQEPHSGECADYNKQCRSAGEVQCDACGKSFCWDHILVLRFARDEAVAQERYVCRNCTERLFDMMQEEQAQLKRDLQLLEHDLTTCRMLLEEA